jgi:hypothetical protein
MSYLASLEGKNAKAFLQPNEVRCGGQIAVREKILMFCRVADREANTDDTYKVMENCLIDESFFALFLSCFFFYFEKSS